MVSFSAEKPSLPRRHLFASLVALVLSAVFLGSGTVTGGAQTGDESGEESGASSTTSTTIDLAAEKERVEAAEAAKAREVDAANAQLGDLTVALAALQERVDAQQARVAYAEEQLAQAERAAVAAQREVDSAESELTTLESEVGLAAIRAFVTDEGDQAAVLAAGDPTKALRMEELRAQATQTDLDLIEVLRVAREDLDVRRAEAVESAAAADTIRRESEEQLTELQADQEAQSRLTSAAEDRLDHLLGERAALATLGQDLSAGEADTDALARQLAAAPTQTPASTVAPPTLVGEDDIAYAGNGIYVHVSIVDEIRQLLIDAAADGVSLAGGGYRSPEGQIAARRNNCGTSNYAIYEMPSSQCSPPTARPGRSMHEQGRAIDFTYNGNLITSRSGPGWNWLVANAPAYGLINLPSEPWHWSTNGR